MAYEKRGRTNICIDCKKACGGCPWSAIDPETDRPAFKPVPGWSATETVLYNGSSVERTYHITACPLFERDEKRKVEQVGELSLEELLCLLAHWKRLGV